MEDKELYEIRKKHFVHSAVHYYKHPIHLKKAKGTRVWDSTGKEYLDAICGIVSISVGHNHPKIVNALKQRLNEDGIQHTTVLYLTEPATLLAQKIANKAPEGLNRVFHTNSGSEANEFAIMAARNATNTETVISLKHSYHGGTLLTTSLCGLHTWKFRSQPFSGIAHTQQPDCYRCPFGKKPESCDLECAKELEKTIQSATCGKIAAVIAEPIMGVGGFIDPPARYHQEIYKTCKKYGGMYISDEVQTALGRTGDSFFAIDHNGVKPDMITMAKSLGNGASGGAVVMTDECSEPLGGTLHFNTFGGDPYQALQASLTMDIIEEENLIKNVKVMGKHLKEGLLGLKEKYQLIGDVRGRGMMQGFELVKDRVTKEYASAEAKQIMELAREKGLLIGTGGLYGNVVRMAPSYTVTKDDVDTIVRILDECLAEVQKQQ